MIKNLTELILHLGAHKTATTFVQKTLQKNSVMLRAAGIQVPRLEELRHDLTNGLGQNDVRKCHFPMARNIVLSDENVIGYPNAAFKIGKFYPDVASRCRVLAGRLPQKPAMILFSVRAYVDYFRSAYALWLGDDKPQVLRDKICDEIQELTRGWPDVINDIQLSFPESAIIVTVYEPTAAFIDQQLSLLVGEIAKKMDYDAKFFWNKILPPQKLMQLETLIQSGGADRQAIADLRKQKLFGKPKPHPNFWTENQRRFLEKRFAADLEKIPQIKHVNLRG